jgi:hypothetical protein
MHNSHKVRSRSAPGVHKCDMHALAPLQTAPNPSIHRFMHVLLRAVCLANLSQPLSWDWVLAIQSKCLEWKKSPDTKLLAEMWRLSSCSWYDSESGCYFSVTLRADRQTNRLYLPGTESSLSVAFRLLWFRFALILTRL